MTRQPISANVHHISQSKHDSYFIFPSNQLFLLLHQESVTMDLEKKELWRKMQSFFFLPRYVNNHFIWIHRSEHIFRSFRTTQIVCGRGKKLHPKIAKTAGNFLSASLSLSLTFSCSAYVLLSQRCFHLGSFFCLLMTFPNADQCQRNENRIHWNNSASAKYEKPHSRKSHF